MKRVLIAGSLAYDRIMDFDGVFSEHFMPEKLHAINLSFLVGTPNEQFGGCGGNIAYGLSLLGVPGDIMATAGSDFDRYGTWLTQHGIGVDTIARAADLPTASAYIMTDRENNQIAAFSMGAMARPYTQSLDLSGYAYAIASPTCPADMQMLPQRCKEARVPYFFDPSQQLTSLAPDVLRESIDGAAGLFVNDYELALVCEKTGWSEADLLGKVGFLAVTLGAEGSRIVTKDGEERIAALTDIAIVDPTGAGDAYRAGFIAGLMRDLPLSVCAKLGSTLAAYAIECYGTQNHRFTKEAFAQRYHDAYQDSIPL